MRSVRTIVRSLSLSVLVLALLAAACSSDPVAPEARDGLEGAAVVQNIFFPAGGTFYNVCTDEFVGFAEGSGFHVVFRVTENANGFHLGFHQNGVNLHGPGFENDGGTPGDPTGTRYHGMLSINETWNASPPFPETYTFLFRTVVNATGNLPNRVQYQKFHVTVNAQGEVTALLDEPFKTECRG